MIIDLVLRALGAVSLVACGVSVSAAVRARRSERRARRIRGR